MGLLSHAKKLRWLEPKRARWAWLNRGVPTLSLEGHFSQYGQDALVERLFSGKRNGVFLDIGANDGVSLSNSYYLERELGWSGLLVEPQADKFAELQACRTAHAVNACASDRDGVLRFIHIEGEANMLSGVASRYSKRHRRRAERYAEETGGTLREVELQAVRIERVLAEKNLGPIDYLSIDTEGGELEILRSIDLAKHRVACITMENNHRSGTPRRYLERFGYRVEALIGCDEVFVQPDWLAAACHPERAAA